MSFEWGFFLNVANELLALAEKEPNPGLRAGLLRSAVSRAYYAAYHEAVLSAQSRLRFVPGRRANVGSHQEVIEFLQSSVRPEVRELGDHLDQIRIARNAADYRVAEPSSSIVRWANEHVAAAESICQDVRQL